MMGIISRRKLGPRAPKAQVRDLKKEKGARISLQQHFALAASFLIGTSTLLMPVGPAKQDGWLAILLAGLLGILFILMLNVLASRFPDKNPFEYARLTLGNVVGAAVGILYILYFVHLGALVLRNVSELYVVVIMPETPILIFAGILAALSAWIVRSGIEPMARLSEFLLPVVVTVIVLLAVFSFVTPGLIHLENLMPVLENGMTPVLKSTFAFFAFPYGEAIALAFLVPSLTVPKRGGVYLGAAAVLITVIFIILFVRNIGVFGPTEGERQSFLALAAIQQIRLGEFFQRIDALGIFVWTFGTFLKLMICHYVAAIGIAELFGLDDYRPVVPVMGAVIVTLSIAIYTNFAEMFRFAFRTYALYALPFQVIIPGLILVVAAIRGLGTGDMGGKGEAQEEKSDRVSKK